MSVTEAKEAFHNRELVRTIGVTANGRRYERRVSTRKNLRISCAKTSVSRARMSVANMVFVAPVPFRSTACWCAPV